MAECSRGLSKVLHVALFVLMCHAATACASLGPNEHEGLAGRVLLASQEAISNWERSPSTVGGSVSFVQPMDDSKVRKNDSKPCGVPLMTSTDAL